MTNPKGTKFETLCLRYLQNWYPDATRLGNQGAKDKGDFNLPGERRFIVQAKNWVKLALSQWMADAVQQAANKGVPHGVILHKRKGKGRPEDQWVTMTLQTFMELVNESSSKKD